MKIQDRQYPIKQAEKEKEIENILIEDLENKYIDAIFDQFYSDLNKSEIKNEQDIDNILFKWKDTIGNFKLTKRERKQILKINQLN